MIIDISESALRQAIAALRQQAKDNAGYSQGEGLIDKEDCTEWHVANAIEHALNKAKQR